MHHVSMTAVIPRRMPKMDGLLEIAVIAHPIVHASVQMPHHGGAHDPTENTWILGYTAVPARNAANMTITYLTWVAGYHGNRARHATQMDTFPKVCTKGTQ